MKKVWVYKRKNIKGFWVGWYESGKRKAKALPTRTLAEHYCQIKYGQLNSDVFTNLQGQYNVRVCAYIASSDSCGVYSNEIVITL